MTGRTKILNLTQSKLLRYMLHPQVINNHVSVCAITCEPATAGTGYLSSWMRGEQEKGWGLGFLYESSRKSSSTFNDLFILLPTVTLSPLDNTNKNHDDDITVKINKNKGHICKISFLLSTGFIGTKTKLLSTRTEKL